MSYPESILPEFDREMATTRKILECVPDDKMDWRAHPKMNTIGWNANHIAEMPGWVEGTIGATSWDFAPPGGEAYQSPAFTSRDEILAYFDRNVQSARRAISSVPDEATMDVNWSLMQAGQAFFTMPRREVIRMFVLNHLIHHRAFLCAQLRLNEIPIPSVYGP